MSSIIKKKDFDKIIKNSTLCKKALKELELAGYINSNDEMSRLMATQVLETLAVFSSHDNSGFSANIELNLFDILAHYKILTPLTFKDNEWDKIDKYLWQNNRITSIFKDDTGKIHYNDAYCYKINKSYLYETKKCREDETKKCREGNGICYFGGVAFLYDNFNKFTGGVLRNAYFTKQSIETGIIPKNTIKLNATEIEIEKNNWIVCVNINDVTFTELQSNYDLDIKYSAILDKKDIFDITPELEKQILKELKNE